MAFGLEDYTCCVCVFTKKKFHFFLPTRSFSCGGHTVGIHFGVIELHVAQLTIHFVIHVILHILIIRSINVIFVVIEFFIFVIVITLVVGFILVYVDATAHRIEIFDGLVPILERHDGL